MKKIAGLTVVLLASATGVQAEDNIQGLPPTESANQIVTSFDQGLQGVPAVDIPFEDFISKSKLTLKLRNYYLNRTRESSNDLLGWAQGGSLGYDVNKVGGFFGFSAEYFNSMKLEGPLDKDGTLLLEQGQEDLHTVGVINPRLTFYDQTVSAYRQKIDLPYVNQQDNRMIPNTFEAYTISQRKAENEKFQYVLGYIDAMKTRNTERFQSMSEAAGVGEGKDRGMILGGGRYFIMPELSVGAANYYVDDVLNIMYTEAVHKVKIDDDWANALSAQYSTQNSVGQDLLRDESYSTFFWGVQDAVSYKNFTGKLAFTMDDTGGTIRSPYGSYPGYNSVVVEDFNRAGEKSWQANIAYNFGRFGLKELGLTASYVYGFNAIDETTKEDLNQKRETDVTIDYKVADGLLSGLWLRFRSAIIEEENNGTTKDFRIIVNYEIPLWDGTKPAV